MNPKWQLAIRQEIDALEKTKTWELTSLPWITGPWVYVGLSDQA